MLETTIKHKPYIFKVVARYFGIEFSLYEGNDLLVMFQLYEEADKIPETEVELKQYAKDLVGDLRELVPFLKKCK